MNLQYLKWFIIEGSIYYYWCCRTLSWLGNSGWRETSPAPEPAPSTCFGMHPSGPHKNLFAPSHYITNKSPPTHPHQPTHKKVVSMYVNTKLWNPLAMIPNTYKIGNISLSYHIRHHILMHQICVSVVSWHVLVPMLYLGIIVHLSLAINRAKQDV